MSTKTTKRIALGVIASLVFAPFAAIAPASATTSLTVTSTTDNVVTSSDGSSVITVTRNAGASTALKVKARLDATPNITSGAVGTVYTTGGPITVANEDGNQVTTFTIVTNTTVGSGKQGVGTYRYTFFVDANDNDVVDSGEVSVEYTHVLAAVAGAGTITASRATIVSSGVVEGASALVPAELTATTFTVSVRDANGNPSVGSVSITETTGDCLAGTASTMTRVGTTNTYTGTYSAIANPAFTAAELAAGFRECTITASGTGATTAPTVKIKLAVLTNLAGDELSVSDVEGVGSYSAGVRQDLAVTTMKNALTAAGDLAVTVDTAVTSLTYTFGGNATTNQALKYVAWTKTPGVLAAADGVNTINYASGLAIINAAGNAVVIDSTTGKAKESYVMQFIGGRTAANALTTNLASIKVTYATATPQINVVSPSGAVKAKFGDSTAISVTLTDQFNRPLGAKSIVYTVAGRNPNVTGVLTTNTAGAANFTLADTSTSTSATLLITDTINMTYNYTTAAGAGATATGSVSISYSATGEVVGSVTLTPAAVDANGVQIDQREVKAGNPAITVEYSAQVYTATGLAHGSGIPVTFTCGTDDKFYLGTSSSVTSTLGIATIKVYRQKAGNAVCTATAGGKTSAQSTPVKWVNIPGNAVAVTDADNGRSDARNVKLSAAQTIVPGSAATVVATVTDRWGNPVRGVIVTFAVSGAGRLVSGDTTTKISDANGNAQVQVTSLSTETGTTTVSATITGAGVDDFAGFVTASTKANATVLNTTGTAAISGSAVAVAGVAAGNATATSTVTFAAPATPVVVVPPVAPTLTGSLNGRVLLFGACMADEGDLIVYVKSPGSPWQERAKTFECAAGEFDGSIRAPKSTKFYRVKQEGTGLWSSSVLIRR